jgi:hypothetical protein
MSSVYPDKNRRSMGAECCDDMIRIKQAFYGGDGGDSGIIKRVGQHEEFMQQIKGVLALMKWVGFSQFLTIIGLIVALAKLFGKAS